MSFQISRSCIPIHIDRFLRVNKRWFGLACQILANKEGNGSSCCTSFKKRVPGTRNFLNIIIIPVNRSLLIDDFGDITHFGVCAVDFQNLAATRWPTPSLAVIVNDPLPASLPHPSPFLGKDRDVRAKCPDGLNPSKNKNPAGKSHYRSYQLGSYNFIKLQLFYCSLEENGQDHSLLKTSKFTGSPGREV